MLLYLVRVAALAALLIAATSSSVAAHAQLESADPAPDSVVDTSPSQAVATFSERLDRSRSRMTVLDPEGATVAQGGVDPADSTAATMIVALPSLGPGSYQVRWQAVTPDDGAIERGRYTFTVAAPAATASPPPATPSVAPPSPTPAGSVSTASPGPSVTSAPATPGASPTASPVPQPGASPTASPVPQPGASPTASPVPQPGGQVAASSGGSELLVIGVFGAVVVAAAVWLLRRRPQ